MNPPIAYTYEADVHCPTCTVARFGRELYRTWDHRARCATCGEEGNLVPLSMADTAHRHGPTDHPFTPRTYPWPPESARDREGNPLGAVWSFSDWCLPCQDGLDGSHSIECSDCGRELAQHDAR